MCTLRDAPGKRVTRLVAGFGDDEGSVFTCRDL